MDCVSPCLTTTAEQVDALKHQLDLLTKERDAALAQQYLVTQRLQNLLGVLPAGVIVIDGRGQIREANAVAKHLLREPLVGLLWRDIIARDFSPKDDDGHEVSTYAGRRLSIAMSPLQGEPGQLLLLQDLTQTRHLQAQCAHNQRLSALGQMVASLAHQIRTPLSAALLYASHLSEKELTVDNQRRFASKLKDRLLDLERQVRDMLIFAKGDLPLLDRVEPSQLMQSLKSAMETRIASHKVRWQCDIYQAVILCNHDMLVSALSNLLENAIEAGAAPIAIKVHLYQFEGRLRITISDNGQGIDQEIFTKLNEPFVTTKSTGTGLGLSVVKAVVHAHKGQFRLRSRKHFGTCATVVLPVLNEALK